MCDKKCVKPPDLGPCQAERRRFKGLVCSFYRRRNIDTDGLKFWR